MLDKILSDGWILEDILLLYFDVFYSRNMVCWDFLFFFVDVLMDYEVYNIRKEFDMWIK